MRNIRKAANVYQLQVTVITLYHCPIYCSLQTYGVGTVVCFTDQFKAIKEFTKPIQFTVHGRAERGCLAAHSFVYTHEHKRTSLGL